MSKISKTIEAIEAPWVIVEQKDYASFCQRCGTQQALPLPCSARSFVQQSAAFLRKHALCEEVKSNRGEENAAETGNENVLEP